MTDVQLQQLEERAKVLPDHVFTISAGEVLNLATRFRVFRAEISRLDTLIQKQNQELYDVRTERAFGERVDAVEGKTNTLPPLNPEVFLYYLNMIQNNGQRRGHVNDPAFTTSEIARMELVNDLLTDHELRRPVFNLETKQWELEARK